MTDPKTDRVAAVDGVRGLLALVVMLYHVFYPLGAGWALPIAIGCVYVFFMISGYVLTRNWDGRFIIFLARRFIRLWPLYALCLSIGYLQHNATPNWLEYFWFPIQHPSDQKVDPPAWSLSVEAWAMLFMPLIVWSTKSSLRRFVFSVAGLAAITAIDHDFSIGVTFMAGAFFNRFQLKNKYLESSIPQWLGKISYSLYLTHFLVLVAVWRFAGYQAGVVAIPLLIGVGWVVWLTVERPCILASRRVAKPR